MMTTVTDKKKMASQLADINGTRDKLGGFHTHFDWGVGRAAVVPMLASSSALGKGNSLPSGIASISSLFMNYLSTYFQTHL